MASSTDRILQVLEKSQIQLLADWIKALRASGARTSIADAELQAQCQAFIAHLRDGVASGDRDVDGPGWGGMREYLADVARSRSRQGFSSSETAAFVLSFKEPLIAHLRVAHGDALGGDAFAAVWDLSTVLDQFALHTTEINQRTRDELIQRQREEMLELSTPVIQLWEGILALPIIGTLDSNRTQVVMEALLQQIVATRSPIAILDITGVATVDTMTAQHLLKTVAAARLMGADCIISGIRPQIAQTIVHLGVDLGDVKTKASLADAFQLALSKLGRTVAKPEA
jgi:rsbT co-antagonist protein RsbR